MHEILHFVQNDKRGVFILATQSPCGELSSGEQAQKNNRQMTGPTMCTNRPCYLSEKSTRLSLALAFSFSSEETGFAATIETRSAVTCPLASKRSCTT